MQLRSDHTTFEERTNSIYRMQVDIAHLQSKLAKIEGAGNLGDKLLGLVNAKHIAEAPAEPEKPEIPEKTESASEKQDSDKGAESSSS